MSKFKNEKGLSALCQKYLEKKTLFKWFIEKYFGLKKYVELWDLAENDQEEELRHELNVIWHELPDTTFNTQCNPPGWETFISLIDE